MEKYIPQKDCFEKALKISRWNNRLLWLSFFISIMYTFEDYWNQIDWINIVLVILNIIIIIAILIMRIYKKIILHKAENIRRDCMIDNALGTNIADEASIGYFDNDEIQTGLKKLLVNVYQNSVFSYENVNQMIKKQTKPTIIMVIPLVVFSVIGFGNLNFSVPVLQLFVSGLVIIKLLDLHIYKNNVEWIKEKAQDLIRDFPEHSKIDNLKMARIIQLVLRYETNIALMQIILDGKVHIGTNQSMTKKWIGTKLRQNIP